MGHPRYHQTAYPRLIMKPLGPARPCSAGPIYKVPSPTPTRNKEATSRKKVIILLTIGTLVLFGILLSQSSFELPFLNPDTQQRFPLLFFAALTILIFLLFVALTFVLARNLLKLF